MNLLKSQDAKFVKDITKLCDYIKKQGGKAYLVGGFVRDALLHIKTSDADIEVFGLTSHILESLLQKYFGKKVTSVGKSYGVYKVRLGKHNLDIALARTESKTGTGHKAFKTQHPENITIKQAAARRDFAINALYYDTETKHIIDPYSGRLDLQNKKLSVVSQKTFVEDPLRVYRAFQFCARFNLSPCGTTQSILKKMIKGGELETLPKERITEEWTKLLLSPAPEIGLELMRTTGLLKKYYPEIQAQVATTQYSPEHPDKSVWRHTLLTSKAAAKLIRTTYKDLSPDDKLTVVLTSFLHDSGKSTATDNHGVEGKKVARVFLKKLSFNHKLTSACENIIQHHTSPWKAFRSFSEKRITMYSLANQIRIYFKNIRPAHPLVGLAVYEADALGRTQQKSYNKNPRKKVRALEEKKLLPKDPTKPLVTGAELLKKLPHLKPGPELGSIIKKIETLRDQEIIRTKAEAFACLKKA